MDELIPLSSLSGNFKCASSDTGVTTEDGVPADFGRTLRGGTDGLAGAAVFVSVALSFFNALLGLGIDPSRLVTMGLTGKELGLVLRCGLVSLAVPSLRGLSFLLSSSRGEDFGDVYLYLDRKPVAFTLEVVFDVSCSSRGEVFGDVTRDDVVFGFIDFGSLSARGDVLGDVKRGVYVDFDVVFVVVSSLGDVLGEEYLANGDCLSLDRLLVLSIIALALVVVVSSRGEVFGEENLARNDGLSMDGLLNVLFLELGLDVLTSMLGDARI